MTIAESVAIMGECNCWFSFSSHNISGYLSASLRHCSAILLRLELHTQCWIAAEPSPWFFSSDLLSYKHVFSELHFMCIRISFHYDAVITAHCLTVIMQPNGKKPLVFNPIEESLQRETADQLSIFCRSSYARSRTLSELWESAKSSSVWSNTGLAVWWTVASNMSRRWGGYKWYRSAGIFSQWPYQHIVRQYVLPRYSQWAWPFHHWCRASLGFQNCRHWANLCHWSTGLFRFLDFCIREDDICKCVNRRSRSN